MSKIGYTKNRILGILALSSKTPTELSQELALNLATVSQHLKELREMGAIEEQKNLHFKKWKSYRINPSFDHASLATESASKGILGVRGKFIAVIVAIASVLALSYFFIGGSNAHQAGTGTVQVALTDPPTVPPGTQALYINYYSVAVQVLAANGLSEWITTPPEVNTSGTLNLLSLVNTSQIIGSIAIPPDSRITGVSFDMPSAEIVVNGSVHSLVLRAGQISSVVSGNVVSGKQQEILMELAPTVTPMYINGEVVYAMVPQASSIALGVNATRGIGILSKLSPGQISSLKSIQLNLTLTNASLKVVNNSVMMSVTVTNTNDGPIVIRDILLLGNQSLVRRSQRYTPNISIPVTRSHMGVEFLIENNSSLDFANQQYMQSSLERINYTYPYATSGYKLLPGQSVTLNFTGSLLLGSNLSIGLTKGYRYKIAVMGDQIVHLVTNVTSG